jgi:hypothetical protein
MGEKDGQIILPARVNVWPHELDTARALARSGRDVEFLVKGVGDREKSADILMEGIVWEIKSPRASNIKAVERNVKRARNQASNVIVDSHRMKGVPDAAIERELRRCAREIKGLKRLLFVDRHGIVTVIK